MIITPATSRTPHRRAATKTSLAMSTIGKGNHLVRDAIQGRRGERARSPELVEHIRPPSPSKQEKQKQKQKQNRKHGHSQGCSPAQAMGIDVTKSVAANRPSTRRKKTKLVDEFITMHGSQYMCSLCGRGYLSLRAAREHMKLKHPESKLR